MIRVDMARKEEPALGQVYPNALDQRNGQAGTTIVE